MDRQKCFSSCVPSPNHCIDFSKCVNPNGYINIVGDADCTEATCTSGFTGSDPETNGFGYEVSCTEPGSTLGANGASTAFIACNCDGKTDCQWESDDLPGPLTEDGVCPSDSDCPGIANPSFSDFYFQCPHGTSSVQSMIRREIDSSMILFTIHCSPTCTTTPKLKFSVEFRQVQSRNTLHGTGKTVTIQ